MSRDKQHLQDYLSHTIKAIQRIQHYTEDFHKLDFLQNEMVQDEVIRIIEVICEASNNIEKHITKFDALIMLITWLLFVTLLMCLHFGSIPSVYATVLAYIILLAGYLSSLASDKLSSIRLKN